MNTPRDGWQSQFNHLLKHGRLSDNPAELLVILLLHDVLYEKPVKELINDLEGVRLERNDRDSILNAFQIAAGYGRNVKNLRRMFEKTHGNLDERNGPKVLRGLGNFKEIRFSPRYTRHPRPKTHTKGGGGTQTS